MDNEMETRPAAANKHRRLQGTKMGCGDRGEGGRIILNMYVCVYIIYTDISIYMYGR